MSVLDDQLAYYRARAAEYDEWFYRRGRYDRGPSVNQRWQSEVQVVRDALDSFRPAGDVLELACGTGIWTQLLAKHADMVHAVDAAPEMLAINRQKLGDSNVQFSNIQYCQADIFDWTPVRQFDVVFFSFWLSHVPKDKFSAFWKKVRSSLRPAGRVYFVDSLPHPESQAKNHPLVDESSEQQTRFLNDGQRFEIVKRYYRPESLAEVLDGLGWDTSIESTPSFFVYGSVLPQ